MHSTIVNIIAESNEALLDRVKRVYLRHTGSVEKYDHARPDQTGLAIHKTTQQTQRLLTIYLPHRLRLVSRSPIFSILLSLETLPALPRER